MNAELPTDSTSLATNPASWQPRQIIKHLKQLREDIITVLGIPNACLNDAQRAYQANRKIAIRLQLAATPLRELKQFAEGHIRYEAIESAGIKTVSDLIATRASQLQSVRGVGYISSERIYTAAKHYQYHLREEFRVRFNVSNQTSEQAQLFNALRSLNEARRSVRPIKPRLEAAKLRIDNDYDAARFAASRFRRRFAKQQRIERSKAALDQMIEFLNEPETAVLESEIADIKQRLITRQNKREATWNEYAKQAATYNGLLAEIEERAIGTRHQSRPQTKRATPNIRTATPDRFSPTTPDLLGDRQLLPATIAEQITSFNLDVTLLGASLRGYQDFGAKFALVQKKVILGDEMGLGKTIEALAMLCHLRSNGATHFFIVCPASVLANWENEIKRHSQLPSPMRLHGHLRNHLLRTWTEQGGLAITTFDTLRMLRIPNIDIDAVIVDEAHYIKNRSLNNRRLFYCRRSERP